MSFDFNTLYTRYVDYKLNNGGCRPITPRSFKSLVMSEYEYALESDDFSNDDLILDVLTVDEADFIQRYPAA